MFGLFNRERYICLGVNPDNDWRYIESIVNPLDLHDQLKSKAFTNEEIRQVQQKLNDNGVPYKNLFAELNWVPEKSASEFQKTEWSILTMVSGVRKEFEASEPHNTMYEKYIAPSIIDSLAKGVGNISYDISPVESEYLKKGVIAPLHFDRYSVLDSIIKHDKKGNISRNLEIREKLEPFSLKPNDYQLSEIIRDAIAEKVAQGNADIAQEVDELTHLLEANEELKERYTAYESYFLIGKAFFDFGNYENAEKYFKKLLIPPTRISPLTIAKEFLRHVGELHEEKGMTVEALTWYKAAVTLAPGVGLKKKIKEMENKTGN